MSGNGPSRRGTSNGNSTGNSADRRRRKEWVLGWFGDGTTCPCYSCGTTLDYATLQIDRIIPGMLGGRYVRGNIRPCCGTCNLRTGNAVQMLVRQGVATSEILLLCRTGAL